MRTLAKVQDPDLITQGLFPSLAPNQSLTRAPMPGASSPLALWRDGENVRFQEGRASKSEGYSIEPTTKIAAQPTYDIVAMTQTFVNENRRIFFGTTNGYNSLQMWDDGVLQEIGNGYAAGRWSLVTFGTWVIGTNNNNPPTIWKDTLGLAAPLGGVNFLRAKIVTKNNNFIIVANLDTGGQRIQWSSISSPEVWTPVVDNSGGNVANTAGGETIRDLDGDIYCMAQIAGDLAFYSQDSMGRMIFTGDQFVFSCKVVLNGIGAVGPNAVATRGAYNFGLGRKGFWQTDGLSYTYVDSPNVKKWLEDNIDWQQAETCVAFHNERLNTIEWHFKCLDGETRGLAYNYDKGAWTKLHFQITAALEQQVFDYPTVAVGRGFGFYGQGTDLDTEPMTAWIRSVVFDANAPDNYKTWDEILLDNKVTGVVQIKFGFSDTPKDEDIEWTDWQTLARDNFVPQQREAPFACFELQSTDVGVTWEISGVNVLGEIGGFI